MNLQTSGRCCSDLRLDRYLVDELDPDERRDLEAHLRTSSACRERLEALRADRDAFRASSSSSLMPPSHLPPLGEGAGASPQRSSNVVPLRRRLAAVLVPAAAAAAAIVVVVQRPADVVDAPIIEAPIEAPTAAPAVDVVRSKGGDPRLTVYVAPPVGAGDARTVSNGDVVSTAEALRFGVHDTRDLVGDTVRSATIVGVDGSGTVAVYVDTSDVEYDDTLLPGAVTLDDVVGDEKLVLWVCDARQTDAALIAATQNDASIAGCSIDVVSLKKQVTTTP